MITFTELLEKAKIEKIAVHTANEKQAKTLLKMLDEKGYKWLGESKLTTETLYEFNKESTCYDFNFHKKVCVSPFGWYKREHYTIIEFSDII